jgi:hypothetical protein
VSRLPAISFCALVAATVGAFFITQHLKVTTPLINGFRHSSDSINPRRGTACGTPPVDHRALYISFYLQHRSDDVDVWMTDSTGLDVATLATDRFMRGGAHPARTYFIWNGREDNGRIAPDGLYYVKVALLHEGRTVIISDPSGPLPVQVDTRPPRPRVLSATPHLISPSAPAVVAIRYRGTEGRGAAILLYRTDLPGPPRLVKTFGTAGLGSATWDGRINQRPAPAGVYLVGLRVRDAACNLGRFPRALPPRPGTTPGAGVTVRYLAAQPSLTATAAGRHPIVLVDSRRRRYAWALRQLGHRRPVARGSSSSVVLRLPALGPQPGLYQLTLRSGAHTTSVPVLADSARPQRVLVVLPALTWQGLNPGDEDGDGIPDTLSAGGAVDLSRPLADGMPAGVGPEAELMAYLASTHHGYRLATDLSLVSGGATLAGHSLVILAGTEQWLPTTLLGALRSYVQAGGHVLSLGIGSLLRTATISAGRALDPSRRAAVDAFGARPGGVSPTGSQLVGVIRDGLGIFRGTSGLFPGFTSYQTILPPAGAAKVSEAGVSSAAPSIVGFRLGRGSVVEIGLPGFAAQLSHDLGAQQLLERILAVSTR